MATNNSWIKLSLVLLIALFAKVLFAAEFSATSTASTQRSSAAPSCLMFPASSLETLKK